MIVYVLKTEKIEILLLVILFIIIVMTIIIAPVL